MIEIERTYICLKFISLPLIHKGIKIYEYMILIGNIYDLMDREKNYFVLFFIENLEE